MVILIACEINEWSMQRSHECSRKRSYTEIQDAGCHNLSIIKVSNSNWLPLKLQISILPFPWGRHCFLGVAIDNYYSLPSTEERYQALNLAIAGC